jgi:hypothetical protein
MVVEDASRRIEAHRVASPGAAIGAAECAVVGDAAGR